MPVYNINKKVTKAASRLGFAPGEELVAACITFPAGHKLKSAIRMGAGGVASMTEGSATRGLASRMPGGRNHLAVTTYRLIATTVVGPNIKPGEISAAWSVDEVVSISVQRKWAASAISITFVDGSVLVLDGMHLSGAVSLNNAIRRS
jgi:hypothetical protein